MHNSLMYEIIYVQHISYIVLHSLDPLRSLHFLHSLGENAVILVPIVLIPLSQYFYCIYNLREPMRSWEIKRLTVCATEAKLTCYPYVACMTWG